MEDLKVKAEAAAEEVKASFKEGAAAFIDDIANDKHTMDELADERKAEKDAKRAAKKAKFESAVAAVLDSFKQGLEEFKSDASFTKDTIDKLNDEDKAARAAKKEAKKEKFNGSVAELKDSIEQGAEAYKEDGDALIDSLKDIAADYGIDIKENETVSNMIKTVKESFADGFKAFKSDASFTKAAIDEVSEERKAEKAEKKAEQKAKFDEKVDAVKESFEEGAAAFKADSETAKAAIDELKEEGKAAKAAKEEAKREKFDEKVEAMKEALK